jgi:hypothetical protein
MWSFFFDLEKFWHGPHQAAWLGVLLLCAKVFFLLRFWDMKKKKKQQRPTY